MRRIILIVAMVLIGCKTVFLQTDNFRAKIDKGCSSEETCKVLVDEARSRKGRCKDNTIGYIRCSDAERDLRDAYVFLKAFENARKENERDELQAMRKRASEEKLKRQEEEKRKQEDLIAQDRQTFEDLRKREKQIEIKREEWREDLRHKATLSEYAVPVVSAIICDLQKTIKGYKSDLRYEKKIERRSGVIDLANRRAIVESMASLEDDIKTWKKLLRKMYKRQPEQCSQLHVQIKECSALSSPVVFSSDEMDDIREGKATFEDLYTRHEAELENQGCEKLVQTYTYIWAEAEPYLCTETMIKEEDRDLSQSSSSKVENPYEM